MSDKATAVIAAAVAGFLGIFFTRYMVSGHTELLVEVLIAQFIGNGLLAAILVTLLIR
jgi:Na+-transporting NADH:ubiquinone oxidoreductase subunit NqrB